jgi:hypothetical protein
MHSQRLLEVLEMLAAQALMLRALERPTLGQHLAHLAIERVEIALRIIGERAGTIEHEGFSDL